MTAPKVNLTELLADREVGTGGEWGVHPSIGHDIVASFGILGRIYLYDSEDCPRDATLANARRIARLPALEAAYIEAVGVVRRMYEYGHMTTAEARQFLGDGE